ncbi:MAG TPA: hypothetical protein PK562_07690, partial [Candidatus Omnitrophota bacterium]|nr:hypothetical protein [Candidatus Omnitrophota bacterium]
AEAQAREEARRKRSAQQKEEEEKLQALFDEFARRVGSKDVMDLLSRLDDEVAKYEAQMRADKGYARDTDARASALNIIEIGYDMVAGMIELTVKEAREAAKNAEKEEPLFGEGFAEAFEIKLALEGNNLDVYKKSQALWGRIAALKKALAEDIQQDLDERVGKYNDYIAIIAKILADTVGAAATIDATLKNEAAEACKGRESLKDKVAALVSFWQDKEDSVNSIRKMIDEAVLMASRVPEAALLEADNTKVLQMEFEKVKQAIADQKAESYRALYAAALADMTARLNAAGDIMGQKPAEGGLAVLDAYVTEKEDILRQLKSDLAALIEFGEKAVIQKNDPLRAGEDEIAVDIEGKIAQAETLRGFISNASQDPAYDRIQRKLKEKAAKAVQAAVRGYRHRIEGMLSEITAFYQYIDDAENAAVSRMEEMTLGELSYIGIESFIKDIGSGIAALETDLKAL